MLQKYDKDLSGTISSEEFGEMLQDMCSYFDSSMKVTKDAVQGIMEMIDTDKNGIVSCHEASGMVYAFM